MRAWWPAGPLSPRRRRSAFRRFNPFKLYANTTPARRGGAFRGRPAGRRGRRSSTCWAARCQRGRPGAQAEEVADVVAACRRQPRSLRAAARLPRRRHRALHAAEARLGRARLRAAPAQHVRAAEVGLGGRGPGDDGDGREVRCRPQRGETLARILPRLGRRALAGPCHDGCGAQRIFPMARCTPDQDMHGHADAVGDRAPIAWSRCASACSARARSTS